MRHLGIDLDGGFADYAVAPRGNVFELPTGTPLGEGVMLSSAIPAATHAVRRAGIGPGARVAVIGIGSVGLAVCQIARAVGAAEVFAADVSQERLDAVAPWVSGSVHVEGLAPEDSVARLQELAASPGIDVAFDTAGAHDGVRTAIGVIRPGGTALLMGLIGDPVAIEFPDYMTGFMRREISIRSTFGFTRTDFLVANALYGGGRLDLRPLAGETIELEGVIDALGEIARTGTRGTRYVVRIGQPAGA
jgi:threonine dehydrogenase-like Zn-dependent dehydrogenase